MPTTLAGMGKPPSRWAVAADQLRAMIHQGAFASGRLASEPAIAAMLGVSRATARQALARLEHDGVVIRKHGSGTFVNTALLHITTRLDEVWDFAEMIRLSGCEPGVRHVATRLEPASAVHQAKLGLASGDEVISVANVFLADGRPVIFCRDVLPGRLVRQAYAPEELHGPIYAFLARRCEQRVSYNVAEVLPVIAGRALAQHLGCPLRAPLHYFEEIGYNDDHQPILYSQEYYVPDAFRFHVVRQMRTEAGGWKLEGGRTTDERRRQQDEG